MAKFNLFVCFRMELYWVVQIQPGIMGVGQQIRPYKLIDENVSQSISSLTENNAL